MTIKIDKWQLFQALASGQGLPELGFVVVNAIEREDGSNHNYNVTGIDENGTKKTIFIQTW